MELIFLATRALIANYKNYKLLDPNYLPGTGTKQSKFGLAL
jgi:hypothetical protein